MAILTFRVEGPEQYGFPHAAGPELDRLAKGPAGTTILEMEAALVTGYTLTEARVHVITGFLKASGHPSSSFDGEQWTGELDYVRYPGIFELARGDTPTLHHPEGGHYFFDPGGPVFERGVRQAAWDFVTGGAGGTAPSGDLGPWSGA
jgi:hypothetical protein